MKYPSCIHCGHTIAGNSYANSRGNLHPECWDEYLKNRANMEEQPKPSQMQASIAESHKKQAEIIRKKNADYSRGEDEYRNFRLVNYVMPWISVEEGIIIRMIDKLARLANLAKYGDAYVTEESFEDTCDDTANYSNILKAFRQNENSNNRSEQSNPEDDFADKMFGNLSPVEKEYLESKLIDLRKWYGKNPEFNPKNGIPKD